MRVALSLVSISPVLSVRVCDEGRDVRAEMREQAVRVMRAWREGLTAWHDHPALGYGPRNRGHRFSRITPVQILTHPNGSNHDECPATSG